MGDIMIQSAARGEQSYDFGHGKDQFTVTIALGINTLTGKEYDAAKEDPGFKALMKKNIYKVMKPADLKKREREEAKEEAKIKELDQAKAAHKKEINELTEAHKAEIKKIKAQHNTEFQSVVDTKGEALKKVKDLEDEVSKLSGKLRKAGENAKALDDAEKKVEALMKENGALNDKFEKSNAELKKVKGKLENGN